MDTIWHPDDHVFGVGDMALFNDNALINDSNTWLESRGTEQLDQTIYNDVGNESDCSWTHEEETGTFYSDMKHRVEHFLWDTTQTTMHTPPLSRQRRRCLHALAQTLQLGHASLGGHGKIRPMIIFKQVDLSQSTSSQTQPLCIPQDASFANNFGEGDLGETAVHSSTKKRKRQQRVDGGFPCQSLSCTRVFDRASERTKHEQTHQSDLTKRFKCIQCEKGFRYPKDLKRHQKVHAKGVMTVAPFGMDNLSLISSLDFDSQAPSEPSWTFSSTAVSKDNSPLLGAHFGTDALIADMEPFKLDDERFIASNTLISMSTI